MTNGFLLSSGLVISAIGLSFVMNYFSPDARRNGVCSILSCPSFMEREIS
jgi:hypothetical protein